MTPEEKVAASHATVDVEAGLIKSVTSKLVVAAVCGAVVSMVAIGALWWALTQSQKTVDNLSSAQKCRSEVAQQEAAALNDIVILLLRPAADHPQVSPEEASAAINRLNEAQGVREAVIKNGCDAEPEP